MIDRKMITVSHVYRTHVSLYGSFPPLLIQRTLLSVFQKVEGFLFPDTPGRNIVTEPPGERIAFGAGDK